jgi:ATP-dependent Lon protease
MELAQLLAVQKTDGDEVKLHLITFNDEPYPETFRSAFLEICDSLASSSIRFSFAFDGTLHDRAIECDNGWKIVLGRGLDIYQKTNGRFDKAEFTQQKRLCKACEATYLEIPK